MSNFGVCYNTKGEPSRGNGRLDVNDDESCNVGVYGRFDGESVVRGDDMIPVTAGEFKRLEIVARHLARWILVVDCGTLSEYERRELWTLADPTGGELDPRIAEPLDTAPAPEV